VFSLSNGLQSIQSFNVNENILDVEIYKETMYISLDSHSAPWILEYVQVNGEWKQSEEKLVLPNVERKESAVVLYWMESMRKRFRGDDKED
jgi:hypothetical protein